MFKANSDIDVKQIWNSLGTFYDQLPLEDREHLQSLWQSFVDTGEANFFNLFQANLSQYLKYAEGYIEHQDEIYSVIFKDTTEQNRENVTLQYLTTPQGLTVSNSGSGSQQYSYKVTAVNGQGQTLPSRPAVTISGASNLNSFNNNLDWNDVQGAESYNVFGRRVGQQGLLANVTGSSYTDTGIDNPAEQPPSENSAVRYWLYPLPEDRDYMSIPTLSGMSSKQIFYEGVDYDIINLDKLRFNKLPTLPSTAIKKEEFWAQNGISLMPSILGFYFKSIGMENPKDVVEKGNYLPKLENWGAQTYLDRRKDYCRHLKYLTYGIVSRLRKEPTIANLEQTYGLLADFPFAYEAGEVTHAGGQIITISGQNTYSYNTSSLDLLYGVGDQVKQFDILISGMQLFDYVNASGLITSYADRQGDILDYDAFIATNSPSKDRLEVLSSQELESIKTSDKLTFVNKSKL